MEHLQDIANVFYNFPLIYLSRSERKIVDILVDAGYCVIVGEHVRRPLIKTYNGVDVECLG